MRLELMSPDSKTGMITPTLRNRAKKLDVENMKLNIIKKGNRSNVLIGSVC